jgi:SurA N-terminal domain
LNSSLAKRYHNTHEAGRKPDDGELQTHAHHFARSSIPKGPRLVPLHRDLWLPKAELNVIASVNGEAIWRSELDRLYKAQQSENDTQAESQDQADTQRLTILDHLIDQTILQQRAVRMNLMANDEEMDIKLHSIEEQYSEAEFTQLLQESGVPGLKMCQWRRATLDKESIWDEARSTSLSR